MIYQKNNNFDYIQSDDSSLAVFDPNKEAVYFFDEVGIDILNTLSSPHSLDELITDLCKIYNASSEIIESDVKEFLSNAVEKNIVITL